MLLVFDISQLNIQYGMPMPHNCNYHTCDMMYEKVINMSSQFLRCASEVRCGGGVYFEQKQIIT